MTEGSGRCYIMKLLNREDAKDAKRVFLLVCYDPGRKIQDQNTPSPDGRGKGQAGFWGFFGLKCTVAAGGFGGTT